jgi:hypothetical protein
MEDAMEAPRRLGRRFCLATLVTALLLTAPLAAAAQSPVRGFVYGGPAGVVGFFGTLSGMQAGGGAEWHIGNGPVSVAGEIGLLGNDSSVLVATSVNGAYHFRARRQMVPFVTTGFTTMGSGEGSFDLLNAGAGVTWWSSRHVGWRGEVRDQIRPDQRGTVHYWGVRAGVVLR